MTFGAENVQATHSSHSVVLDLNLALMPRQRFFPLLHVHLVLSTLIVKTREVCR